jgi:hypothetical protein
MKIEQIEPPGLEMPYKKLLITATNKFVVAPGAFHQIESRHDWSNSMTN